MNKEKERSMAKTLKEESEKIEKFFKNYRNIRRSSANNLEARVKALEEAVAALTAKQDNKEEV